MTTALQPRPTVKPTTTDRSIEKLTKLAVSEYQEGLNGIRRSLMHFIKAGSCLNEIKGQLRHGEWGPWLKANWPTSEREAQRCMEVANGQKELAANTTGMSDLSLSEALRRLGGPQEPCVQRQIDWVVSPEKAEAQIARALEADELSSEQATELMEELRFYRESVEVGWTSGPVASSRLRAQLSVAKKQYVMPPGKQDSEDALRDLKSARDGLRATRNALRRLDPVALSQDFDNPFGSMDRREKVHELVDNAVEVGTLLDGLRVTGEALSAPAVEVHTTPSPGAIRRAQVTGEDTTEYRQSPDGLVERALMRMGSAGETLRMKLSQTADPGHWLPELEAIRHAVDNAISVASRKTRK